MLFLKFDNQIVYGAIANFSNEKLYLTMHAQRVRLTVEFASCECRQRAGSMKFVFFEAMFDRRELSDGAAKATAAVNNEDRC
uniref:Uncharacterized protein n=1 Tax=Romanomermis culicivorax TaxID=13658 RepID=A0A915K7M4_ROMCU